MDCYLIAYLKNKPDTSAHLFNFVGDGLKQARTSLSSSGVELAKWPEIDKLMGELNSRNG